jgi:hypothetical protein
MNKLITGTMAGGGLYRPPLMSEYNYQTLKNNIGANSTYHPGNTSKQYPPDHQENNPG